MDRIDGMNKQAKGKMRLQRMARRKFGTGSLAQLFTRAARFLNVSEPVTKADGYELLRRIEGVSVPKVPKLIPAQLRAYRDSAPCWAKPVATVDPASDDFLWSYEWRRIRMVVLKQHGARCQCCGASAKDGVRIHVDHVKPRKLFPELALDTANLQVLCEVCNHGKGNWDQTDWRGKVANG